MLACRTFSHAFVRGLLEAEGRPVLAASTPVGPSSGGSGSAPAPAALVRCDLGVHQRVLEAAR